MKFNLQYSLIAEEYLKQTKKIPDSILDLGCGVGGGMLRLARTFPDASVVGLTLSSEQQTIGNQMIESVAMENRVRIERGDYSRINLNRKFDLICAVESAIHCESPDAFFEGVRRHAHEETIVVIIDDFLMDSAQSETETIRTYKKHWHVPGLDTVRRFEEAARGWEVGSKTDLTDYLELGRPRDRVIAGIFPLLKLVNKGNWPFLNNMIGGHSLQSSLLAGDLSYLRLAFRRSDLSV